MEVIKNKGIGINSLLLIISGVVIIFGSVLIYVYVLKGVFGTFEFNSDLGSLPFASAFTDDTQINVGILNSKYTENMLPEGSTWLADNLITWKRTLAQYNINVTVLQDSDIERGRHYNLKLLILPGSKSLSDEEVTAIKTYIDKGGSVLATSGTASFSADGKWRGWEFFSEVFGMRFYREIPKEEVTRIMHLRGGYPITANIPTGFPMKIATWDLPIAMQVLEPRTTQVSYWFNRKLDLGLVKEELRRTSGISYGTYGKGRFVWMGFEINAVVGRQEDFVFFDRLLRNSINWLLYRPIANVKDWPGDYRSAAIIVPVIEDSPNNILNLLPILSSTKTKAAFFIDPVIAEANPELTRNIAKFGEIGAVVDIGFLASVNDTINKLNDGQTQYEKFKSAKDKLKAITGEEIKGIYPMYGLYDDNSMIALGKSGYQYIFSDSLTDRSIPKVIIKDKTSMITITKTARDDYEVIRDLGLTDPEFQMYTYEEDIERIEFEGGLYVFKLHTAFQCAPENVMVVKSVIDTLKSKKVWLTTPGELHNWWSKRNKIEMRVESRSESRIAVTLSNSGKETLETFKVSVDLQKKIKNLILSSEIIGTEIPKYNYNPSTSILEMTIDKMSPGDTRIYYLDFDSIE